MRLLQPVFCLPFRVLLLTTFNPLHPGPMREKGAAGLKKAICYNLLCAKTGVDNR